jgi:hypothetical protein
LEVGEFDEGEFGGLLAFHRRSIHTEHHVLGLSGGGSPCGTGAQQGFEVLEVLLDGFLAVFEGFDVATQALNFFEFGDLVTQGFDFSLVWAKPEAA